MEFIKSDNPHQIVGLIAINLGTLQIGRWSRLWALLLTNEWDFEYIYSYCIFIELEANQTR